MMHSPQTPIEFSLPATLAGGSPLPCTTKTIKPSMRERRIEQSRSKFITDRFGTRLRETRIQRHMSQIDMAVAFGIDRSFISDVERGRKSIGLPMLEVIAIGFGMTLAELMENL